MTEINAMIAPQTVIFAVAPTVSVLSALAPTRFKLMDLATVLWVSTNLGALVLKRLLPVTMANTTTVRITVLHVALAALCVRLTLVLVLPAKMG